MMKEKVQNNRELEGVVVSSLMQKTVVVRVSRTVKHPVYDKYIRYSKKYKVHDEHGLAKQGDVVRVRECAPISKTKHMVLCRVVQGNQERA